MRRALAALSALGLLLLSGCATFGSAPDPCSYPAGASSAFPGSTLEDWVTYGDHAVVLSGVDKIAKDGRKVVRLRHERTLWSRDQAPAAPPAEAFAETKRNYDSAAAKPGHQYLLVGTWWDWDSQHVEQPDWVHLQLLAFDGGDRRRRQRRMPARLVRSCLGKVGGMGTLGSRGRQPLRADTARPRIVALPGS
jgi:hypothetical protein